MEYFVRVALSLSMALLVLSLGLQTKLSSALSLLRAPAQLARATLSMYVVMPLLMVAFVDAFELRAPVKIALIALSLSPVPPFLPRRQLSVSSHQDYVVGLFVGSAVLSVLLAPIAVEVLILHYGRGESLGPLVVLQTVLLSVILPLALGIVLRGSRASSPRMLRALNAIGVGLLALSFAPVLLKQWPAMLALIGNGTLAAILCACALGLLVGHLLGGPFPEDRTALALATASRHPAVALAIASEAFTAQNQRLLAPAILLALLVNALAATPYVAWRRRWRSAPAAPNAASGDSGNSSLRHFQNRSH